MPPFVTYALLVGCLAVLIVGIMLERRKGPYARYAWIVQVLAFVFAYLVVRPGRGVENPSEVVAQAKGAPVFLDLYSNY